MRWFSAIGGSMATAAAVAVLVSLAAQSVPVETDAQAQSAVGNEPAAPVDQVVYATVEELPSPVNPDLLAMDRSVSDVLADAGYTEFVDAAQLSQGLSPEVLEFLIANEAVLVIPSEETE